MARRKRYFIETPGTDEVQAYVGTKSDRYLESSLVEAAASAIHEMLSSGGDECEIRITTAMMSDSAVAELPEV